MPGTVAAPALEESLLEAASRLAEAERRGDLVALEQLLASEYDAYVWRDGRWQLIASQDTRLPR